MRKIIVLSMISLDGVMQAPGGPEEDTSDGFKYGGWVAPYRDEVSGKVVQKELQQIADYLLGRKTFGLNMPAFGRASMMAQNTLCLRPKKNQIGKTPYSSKVWKISKR